MGSQASLMSRPGSPLVTADPQVRLRRPGLFARNYGTITPVGVLMAHRDTEERGESR